MLVPPAALDSLELYPWHAGAGTETAASPFTLNLNTTCKLTGYGAANPPDRQLYPQRSEALLFTRLRFMLTARWRDQANVDVAYEQAGQFSSFDRNGAAGGSDAGAGLGVGGAGASGGGATGAGGDLAFRVTPLTDTLIDRPRFVYIHDLDRLLFAWHPNWGEVTVGRQAIGLGRGVLFGALDLFAPFSPLAVDREWRPGVDAVRVERHLTDSSSIEAIAVGGTDWAQSAGLVRMRGYLGPADAEIMAGVRAQDLFAGADASSAIGDAELHGEFALFRTLQPHPDGEPFGDPRLVPKFLFGGSYTFNSIGAGLTVVAEYFYSGFGAPHADQILPLLADPDYAVRFARGDSQILGRHAFGVQATYPFATAWTGSCNLVVSPVDGSGALAPILRWDATDTASWTLSATLPWGRPARGPALRSEYGATPASLFLQAAWYL
ncbi:MAG: hypothetical protein ACREJ2_06145 [Planctomycetota bacterium]